MENTTSTPSAPPLRSSARSIDGFFRPRTVASHIIKTPPAVDNSIASLAKQATPSAPELTTPGRQSGRTANHTRAHTPQAATQRTIAVSAAPVQTHAVAVNRGSANHVQHHTAQHSTTLRRDTVPAPAPSTHNLLRPKSELQHTVPGLIEIKKSAGNIDADRLVRAQGAAKNPLVARHAKAQPLLPTFAPLPVQPSPTPPGTGSAPDAPPPQQTNKPTDIFEHALANANNFVDIRAHRARYKQHARFHLASMTAGSLALVVIVAFAVYQNSPGLQFKLATLKAGVSASMPNFAAAGFAYNGARAGDGKLMLGFRHAGTTYQLTQANTNFSDADMIQSIGSTNANGTPTYDVLMAGNTMVYRFGNTNATWVSNGKWYTVNGNGALTDGQVEALVHHV